MREHGPNAFESASSKIGPRTSIYRRRQKLGRHEGIPSVPEKRITSSTGGQKGRKEQRMELLPPKALMALSEIYARGAEKYDDYNYLRGYDWSLAYGAMQRHLNLWQSGEDIDSESGKHHLLHAAWHALTLWTFQQEELGTDDRYGTKLADERPEKPNGS